MLRFGGGGRIRTDVDGFAIRCLASWLHHQYLATQDWAYSELHAIRHKPKGQDSEADDTKEGPRPQKGKDPEKIKTPKFEAVCPPRLPPSAQWQDVHIKECEKPFG